MRMGICDVVRCVLRALCNVRFGYAVCVTFCVTIQTDTSEAIGEHFYTHAHTKKQANSTFSLSFAHNRTHENEFLSLLYWFLSLLFLRLPIFFVNYFRMCFTDKKDIRQWDALRDRLPLATVVYDVFAPTFEGPTNKIAAWSLAQTIHFRFPAGQRTMIWSKPDMPSRFLHFQR